MIRFVLPIAFLVPAVVRADDAKALLMRAGAAVRERKNDEALRLLNDAIQADPKLALAYELRGVVHFRLAKIAESLADFDKQIELDPKAAGAHWRRGLTLYYADKFADGVAQFTTSDKAEPEDVENAIWHFLCNARVKGIDKARGEFLKVKQDSRGEPMMKIYQMFKGEVKPDDALAASEPGTAKAEERNSRHFYANYYIGMYHEAAGEPAKSLEYLKKAVEKYPVPDYMMDVARVHIKLREKK
jgi:lipoprotein NlpI